MHLCSLFYKFSYDDDDDDECDMGVCVGVCGYAGVCVGEGQVFTVGKIGKHRVVSTKLPRIGQSEAVTDTATRSTITRLLG